MDSLYQLPDPNRANNIVAATTGQIDIGLPALTLGTPYTDSFTAADQDHYYQITVPAGGSLNVSLQSSASSGAVALYISQGTLPTPYNYQEAADVANQPNQTAVVPQVLTSGTYYILAHSVSGAAATASFTVTATQTGRRERVRHLALLGGQRRQRHHRDRRHQLHVGRHRQPDPRRHDHQRLGHGLREREPDVRHLQPGRGGRGQLYPERAARRPDGDRPEHVPGGGRQPGLARTWPLVTPQYIRAGRTGTIVITYTNETENDIVAPLLNISSTNANVFFSTPDNPNDLRPDRPGPGCGPERTGRHLAARPERTAHPHAPVRRHHRRRQIPVQVSQIKPGQTIDWAAQQTSLSPHRADRGLERHLRQSLAMIGTTTDSYNAALAQAATYLSGLGETTAQVSDVGRLWSFLVAQADADFPTLDADVHRRCLAARRPAACPWPSTGPSCPSIAGRSTPGIFGLGWATSWQTSLSVDSSGNVTINGGPLAYFPSRPTARTSIPTANTAR